jgi:hypothetical protein
VRCVLSVLSPAVMPALASADQRTGEQVGSEALKANAAETSVCSYLSFPLSAVSQGWESARIATTKDVWEGRSWLR